jgi:hypothetical protein
VSRSTSASASSAREPALPTGSPPLAAYICTNASRAPRLAPGMPKRPGSSIAKASDPRNVSGSREVSASEAKAFSPATSRSARASQPSFVRKAPGRPHSMKSCASKCERVGCVEPTAWTTASSPLSTSGSSGASSGWRPKPFAKGSVSESDSAPRSRS